MAEIKAIIVDDEKRSSDNLKKLLTLFCPEVLISGIYFNIQDAYDAILKQVPQLVFLDVEMPPDNGFDLLKKFEILPFEVIFVTAFDHYAIEAIKFSALYYLQKPINTNELKISVNKMIAKYTNEISGKSKNVPKKLTIKQDKGIVYIDLANIMYCKSDNNYCMIYVNDGKKYLMTISLSKLELSLSQSNFVRTHQSYLVNIDYINRYLKTEGGQLELKNGTLLDVSRRKKDEVLRLLSIQ